MSSILKRNNNFDDNPVYHRYRGCIPSKKSKLTCVLIPCTSHVPCEGDLSTHTKYLCIRFLSPRLI